MTTTQMHGLRKFHTAVTSIPTTMTAYEMALTSHKLSKDGNTARCADGRTFCWIEATQVWTQRA